MIIFVMIIYVIFVYVVVVVIYIRRRGGTHNYLLICTHASIYCIIVSIRDRGVC